MATAYKIEGNTEEFTSLAMVATALGVKRISKADLASGKYPTVSLLVADDSEDVDAIDEVASEGDGQDLEALEDGEVPTDLLDMGKELGRGTELDANTLAALEKVEKAMDTANDTETFDALCEIEDALRAGIDLTDEQAVILTGVLNGYISKVVVDEDSITLTVDVPDLDEVDEEDASEDVPPTDDPNAGRTHYGDDNQGTEYPEVGSFKDETAMKKFIKATSNDDLTEWCALEGVTYATNSNESIQRMRQAMAIKALHFPTTAKGGGTKKSKSKYGAYTTEALVQMALENDVEVPDDKGDMRICRMYTIMALKKAGHLE